MKFLAGLVLLLGLVALTATMVLPDSDDPTEASPLLRIPRAAPKCVLRTCDFNCRANQGRPGGYCKNNRCECEPVPSGPQYLKNKKL